jgi:hypothetical protein
LTINDAHQEGSSLSSHGIATDRACRVHTA